MGYKIGQDRFAKTDKGLKFKFFFVSMISNLFRKIHLKKLQTFRSINEAGICKPDNFLKKI